MESLTGKYKPPTAAIVNRQYGLFRTLIIAMLLGFTMCNAKV